MNPIDIDSPPACKRGRTTTAAHKPFPLNRLPIDVISHISKYVRPENFQALVNTKRSFRFEILSSSSVTEIEKCRSFIIDLTSQLTQLTQVSYVNKLKQLYVKLNQPFSFQTIKQMKIKLSCFKVQAVHALSMLPQEDLEKLSNKKHEFSIPRYCEDVFEAATELNNKIKAECLILNQDFQVPASAVGYALSSIYFAKEYIKLGLLKEAHVLALNMLSDWKASPEATMLYDIRPYKEQLFKLLFDKSIEQNRIDHAICDANEIYDLYGTESKVSTSCYEIILIKLSGVNHIKKTFHLIQKIKNEVFKEKAGSFALKRLMLTNLLGSAVFFIKNLHFTSTEQREVFIKNFILELIKKNNYPLAKHYIKQYIKDPHVLLECHSKLLLQLIEDGKIDEACMFRKNHNCHGLSTSKLYDVLLEKDQIEKVKALVTTFSQSEVDKKIAYTMIHRFYVKKGQFDTAQKYALSRVTQKDQTIALQQLVEALLKYKQIDQAQAVLPNFIGITTPYRQSYESIINHLLYTKRLDDAIHLSKSVNFEIRDNTNNHLFMDCVLAKQFDAALFFGRKLKRASYRKIAKIDLLSLASSLNKPQSVIDSINQVF